MLGYVSPVQAPVNKRTQFLNTIRQICGSVRPVACWLPDGGDGGVSTDPISGRVWTGETATNLCTNGGFETNTTGWAGFSTGAIARDTTTFRFGTASGKVTANAAFDGMQMGITLTVGQTYTLSGWVQVPTTKTFALKMLDALATPASPTVNVTGNTGVWQYVYTTWVCGTAASFFQTFDNANSSYPYNAFVDGLQVQVGLQPTPYIETNGGTASAIVGFQTNGSLKPLGRGVARSFDGLTNFLTTPDTTDLSMGNGTTDSSWGIFAVINMAHTSGAKIVCKDDNALSAREWSFNSLVGDTIQFIGFDQSAAVTWNVTTNSAVPLSSWITLGLSYNGAGGASAANGATMYLNGAVVASTPINNASYVASENLTALGSIGMGQPSSPAAFFLGSIACILVTSINLTAAQQLALHNPTRSYFGF